MGSRILRRPSHAGAIERNQSDVCKNPPWVGDQKSKREVANCRKGGWQI